MKKRYFLFPVYLVTALLIVSTNSWSETSDSMRPVSLSQHLDNIEYLDPDSVGTIKQSSQKYIAYSELKSQEKSLTLGDEFLEVGKIIGMGALAAVSYGIIHDLIATQLNFAYFSDLHLTHHGITTKENFPSVYKSESRILYALLWGTISTWWVGLPLGTLSAVAARAGSSSLKSTWQDVIKPAGVLLGTNLAISLFYGGFTYLSTGSSFAAVSSMHNSSHIVGAAGGLILPFYIYFSRPTLSGSLQEQCVKMTEVLMILFKENPDNSDMQEIIRFRLNSTDGNCQI